MNMLHPTWLWTICALLFWSMGTPITASTPPQPASSVQHLLGKSTKTPDLCSYVDPHIGSGGHGHVFVGANVPFGLVQLGPTALSQEWDWTSGYHYGDSTVIGFPHTHLSGTGIGDLHDVTLMPVTGKVTYARGAEKPFQPGLWSYADLKREVCEPGYYATFLTRYQIGVELTATARVGFHKYTFPKTDSGAVVIDLQNGGGWDKATEAQVERIDECTLAGYRYSRGWANRQRIYFVAQFSQPITQLEVIADSTKTLDNGSGKIVYAHAHLDTQAGKPVYVKVALSPTSIAGAQANLKKELRGWNFEKTRKQARKLWNKALAKIKIQAKDTQTLRTFYTALYHTMVAPSIFCDVNGDYRGADGEVHRNANFVNYTTFSCWDTYRAAHPLMSLIHPERMADMMQTFIQIHQEQGKLPVWHLMGCETNCMVGSPGICIVADGLLKGYIRNPAVAYEALKQTALLDERGMAFRKKYGYIPCDKMKESVAYDMEYAIADGALARVAQQLGHAEDADYFLKRSHSYRHYFDPATGFMRGLTSDGRFNEPFNPYASTHRDDDYCEGTAWQYTFLAPHDFEGLVDCFGGKEPFLKKLDALFTAESQLMGGNSSPDISGMIGQYVHGNEPSHHIIYFYTLAGQPWKTAQRIREVMRLFYYDEPEGLCGNEDVGAMSAWYLLSALGFYQVEPAGGRYVFGSPIIDEAVLRVRDGKFKVVAHNNSPENKYIQRTVLNGKELTAPWIDFEQIAQGGTLEFYMGNQPVPLPQ